MKNFVSLAIVAFLALAFTSCEPDQVEVVDTAGLEPDYHSAFNSAYMTEEKMIEENKAISKSQEIPTGQETFDTLVAYIWEHGFTISGGADDIPCGKQYTFFDSKGNRHAYLAIKTDTVTKQASMTGKVQNIYTYGYLKGIRDQNHFFPYDINATSVYCPILEMDGTWGNVEEATFGYKEFLAKVIK